MLEHKITPIKSDNKNRRYSSEFIIKTIQSSSGKSITDLKNQLSEDALFFESLKYITTTKKAICEAMGIPIEAACRYKRMFEKRELLVQSSDKFTCPFTKRKVHFLSTDPNEFDRLRKPKTDNQLKLF